MISEGKNNFINECASIKSLDALNRSSRVAPEGCHIEGYSSNPLYTGTFTSTLAHGTVGKITTNNQELPLSCPALMGDFNAYNITAAASMALSLGITPELLQKACLSFAGVQGRLNRYDCANGATFFIDHAHNPSSFNAVLSLLSSLTSQLIVVFGAGGERDRTKRPVMGQLAASFASTVILTTDNPRSEDPALITQEIVAGITPEYSDKVIIRARSAQGHQDRL